MKLVRNFLSLAGAEVLGKVATFVAFAYLARLVGPEGLGYVEFAGAVLLCLGLLVDQGFDTYGAREIAKDPRCTAALTSEIVFIRAALACLMYACVVGLAMLLDRSAVQIQLLLIYGLSLFAMPLLLRGVFQGHERMRVVAVAQIIRQLVFAVIVLGFLRDPGRLWFVGVAELAGTIAAAGFFLGMYRRAFGHHLRLRPTWSTRLLREGMTIGLSQMFWSMRMYGATILVGVIATERDVGYVGGAMRILIALHTFVWLYYFNLLPTMARNWKTDRASFHVVIHRSMRAVAWLALGGGVLWVLLAPLAMRATYGPAFREAGSTLQVLAAVCVLAFISGHFRFALIATGHQMAEMVTAALGSATALLLIPFGYAAAGPLGVAIALVLGETVVWLAAWRLASQAIGTGGHLATLARPMLAAVVASVVVVLLPMGGLLVQVAVAAAVLVGMAYLSDRTVRERCDEFVAWARRRARGWPKGSPPGAGG